MEWETLYARAQSLLPEAFGAGGEILNLVGGERLHPGHGKSFMSPCDDTPLCIYPMLDDRTAQHAVHLAAREHETWPRTDLDERCAFKVGINQVRSRGDRDEPFGGIGESWKGCFVGGRYLVQAVTAGPPGERLYGNFPDYTLLAEDR